jgi:tetratricopeptide (TPR) repeat protein
MRHCCVLVSILAVSTSSAFAADSDSGWVGKKVMVKTWNAKLAESGKDLNSQVDLGDIFTITKTNADWLWVGRGWIQKSDVVPLDQSIGYFTAQISRDPNDNQAYHNRAEAYWKIGELDKAIADEGESIRLYPQTSNYNGRGQIWLQKKEFDIVIADFNEAIRLSPKFAVPYYNRAKAWYSKKQYDKAIEDFNEAVRLNPNYAFAFDCRGRVFQNQGNYKKALDDFDEAIRLDPGEAWAYDVRAWIWATCPAETFRDGTKAVESATRACELTNWDEGGFLDMFAAAYAEESDFDSAVKWETKALGMKLNLDDSKSADLRARLELYKSGKPYREEAKATKSHQRRFL